FNFKFHFFHSFFFSDQLKSDIDCHKMMIVVGKRCVYSHPNQKYLAFIIYNQIPNMNFKYLQRIHWAVDRVPI
ncbi:hypothetical protein BLA29_006626, partial [Euroglyphus maynei]